MASIQVTNPESIGRNAQLYPDGVPAGEVVTSSSSGGGRLAGKVALITGAGSGYGEGMAKAFAAEGAKVIIGDINQAGGEKVAQTAPDSMFFFKLDVTSEESWKAVMDFGIKKFGKIDVLVNNAGASYVNKPSLDVTMNDFEKCFNVNVKSIFLSTHAFLPPLINSKQPGCVLNISSTGATRPRPGLVWYNASKGAVSNATKALAAEYGPQQIRFNAICPLLGNTGLFSTFTGMEGTEENVKNFIGNVPMGRLCTPGDVAGAAVWLCSDEAAFVTGQTIQVDGGKTI